MRATMASLQLAQCVGLRCCQNRLHAHHSLLRQTPLTVTPVRNKTTKSKGWWRRGEVQMAATSSRVESDTVEERPRIPADPLPNLQRFGLPDLKELADVTGVDRPPEFRLRDVKATSYVSRRRMDDASFDPDEVDDTGLPLVYNEEAIARFWKGRPGDLASRWAKFVGVSGPWLVRLANAFLRGNVEQQQQALAKDAVDNLQRLGPTFIKLGQILSIRPDVLPPVVMLELAKLQDNILPFSTEEAREVVERELGRPIDEVFSEFSAEPIAAASLAQVYRARLREEGLEVAVKVQRPDALSTISKDLYVLRRAVGVYERLVKRFTAQTTDYQSLLATFAEGLYTEMDFRNEALNSGRMTALLEESEFAATDLVIPETYMQYTTRRVLTMEWITGVKLTGLDPAEVRVLVKVGQEAFLTQLLEIGFFHGDPHPGNLLKVTEGPNEGKLALLDFGLVAEIPQEDREAMVAATIHLGNRDWDGLITDFQALGFLPEQVDRGRIMPVMERVLGPYLRGGGARAFDFSSLSRDLLSATLEIPFSVPPYMSLLARSVATLEGIALVGDPGYQMVAQAYPFVVRKVLRNARGGGATLLRDIMYDAGGKVRPARLSALLNAALGHVATETEGFVDFDAVPKEGASPREIISFLLSEEARDLRPLLTAELINICDLSARTALRRSFAALPALVPRVPLLGWALPTPPLLPVYLPGAGLVPLADAVERLAPPLEQEEEIYVQSLSDLFASLLGRESAPEWSEWPSLLFSPTDQMREIQGLVAEVGGSEAEVAALRGVALQVLDSLTARQAERLGVEPESIAPLTVALRRFL